VVGSVYKELQGCTQCPCPGTRSTSWYWLQYPACFAFLLFMNMRKPKKSKVH